MWSPKQNNNFFRRQFTVGLLIVSRTHHDPRPGLRTLSINPFLLCITHWYTIHNHYSTLFSSTTCGKMADLLRVAIANLQTCFSGSENTQTVIARYCKTISLTNWREEVLHNTHPLASNIIFVMLGLWCYSEHRKLIVYALSVHPHRASWKVCLTTVGIETVIHTVVSQILQFDRCECRLRVTSQTLY